MVVPTKGINTPTVCLFFVRFNRILVVQSSHTPSFKRGWYPVRAKANRVQKVPHALADYFSCFLVVADGDVNHQKRLSVHSALVDDVENVAQKL
jgi:hypothetical protein